jgi:hypothetical protein
MAELKTKPTDESVTEFLSKVENDKRRTDCHAVLEMMRQVTGAEPKIWGKSMIGFGRYRYRYESGREGEWFLTGFSPRKSDLTLYVMPGYEPYEELMDRLGKHKRGKACLYLKKLEDVDLSVLRELLERSVASLEKMRVDAADAGR